MTGEIFRMNPCPIQIDIGIASVERLNRILSAVNIEAGSSLVIASITHKSSQYSGKSVVVKIINVIDKISGFDGHIVRTFLPSINQLYNVWMRDAIALFNLDKEIIKTQFCNDYNLMDVTYWCCFLAMDLLDLLCTVHSLNQKRKEMNKVFDIQKHHLCNILRIFKIVLANFEQINRLGRSISTIGVGVLGIMDCLEGIYTNITGHTINRPIEVNSLPPDWQFRIDEVSSNLSHNIIGLLEVSSELESDISSFAFSQESRSEEYDFEELTTEIIKNASKRGKSMDLTYDLGPICQRLIFDFLQLERCKLTKSLDQKAASFPLRNSFVRRSSTFPRASVQYSEVIRTSGKNRGTIQESEIFPWITDKFRSSMRTSSFYSTTENDIDLMYKDDLTSRKSLHAQNLYASLIRDWTNKVRANSNISKQYDIPKTTEFLTSTIKAMSTAYPPESLLDKILNGIEINLDLYCSYVFSKLHPPLNIEEFIDINIVLKTVTSIPQNQHALL
ncbi:hypothetical protein ACOME3_000261 [Neoechinorhynchus agilis]